MEKLGRSKMPKISKEQFVSTISRVENINPKAFDYLYDTYDISYDAGEELIKIQQIQNAEIDSHMLISYILGEFLYSTASLSSKQFDEFLDNENIQNSMASVAADKYLSLSVYEHKEGKLTSKYLPPISSLSLYLNLLANIVSRSPRNDPRNTLIVDLLSKSISISRSIINLLVDGYETEAFAVWRTLHECECTLILLERYGNVAIDAYLKHMRFGLAYKNTLANQEDNNKVMEQVKNEMSEHSLKSKDTKKYIEYGWLYAIPTSSTTENFKLNFRDGLESLAGLHQYAEIYMTSSEILHSTPLLIYSNKTYFYFVTLLNLYESFFRIEKVFQGLYFSLLGSEGKEAYLEMRKLYYSQLINIHKKESYHFQMMFKKKEK